MNGKSWKAALVGAAAAISTLARPAGADEGLTLRRVLLSSGGVGYFEYAAKVTGDGELSLPVRLDDIDDVLKSIVVYDDRGGMGEVTLPGKAAANEAFRDLPFDPGSLGSPESLLVALRGAEVTVKTAEGVITGRILSVTTETVQLPAGAGVIVRHRLAIATNGEIKTVILEEAESVQFVDVALRAQLDAALASLLAQKDRGRRTLVVHTRGEGEREVRVGYVVSVPVWKSTYRLTLSTDPAARTAELVGLAIVENQSGADFVDVDLTLISGNPVTFRQALYQAYYVDRPWIPVEVAGRVLPRLDEGAVRVTEKHLRSGFGGGMPPSAMGVVAGARDFGEAAPMMAPSPQPMAESTEEATQIVFHLPEPISIAAGEEALIPIIDRDVPAQRVSVYQPELALSHPFASVLLENDGETGLPPGAVTTFERTPAGVVTYLGDARLAAFPLGEKRLVSFGADTKVRVDRRDHTAETITLATLARGTLTLTRTERIVTEYTIAGAAREPRKVVVEHARIEGFDLASPRPEGIDVTATHYRIPVDVPAGETVTLTVTLARPIQQTIAVLDLPAATLEAYASAPEIPAAVREALSRIAALRSAVDEKIAAVKAVEADLARITAEQTRIRENLKVVPAGSALSQRYLTLLGEQEDRIAALETQLADARRALLAAEAALAAAIRAL